MARVVVFAEPALRRRLKEAPGGKLRYEFFASPEDPDVTRRAFDGALLECGRGFKTGALRAVRRSLPGRPVGAILIRPSPALLQRAARAGFDFLLEAWGPKDPAPESVLAHLQTARAGSGGTHGRDVSGALKKTTKRLAILTDIVKTANSILEPRKVIELIMEKIQQLIPSEAWSMLMVDEEKQELAFELALGAKGKDVSSFRVKIGEGVAGWVAQTGKPAIVNDTAKDPRFARTLRHQDPVPDPLHPLRAPHLPGPHHRGGGDHQPAGGPLHPEPTSTSS